MIVHLIGLIAAGTISTTPSFLPQATPDQQSARETEAPLFAAEDVLRFTLEAPLDRIIRERKQDPEEFDGTVTLTEAAGGPQTLPVEVQTRGKARLDRRICGFPPLRLDFPKDSLRGTVLEGQNKIKLVTHCQDGKREYEQYVLLEYLIYRTYNLLTPMSFQVRLAHITYIDTDAKRDPVTRYGFLIEDKDHMAARNGWEAFAAPGIPPDAIEPANLALVEVFQYFIGNTDFSAFASEAVDDACCHNTKPVGNPAGQVFTVPYDFDMAGLLNTRYANRLYRENLRKLRLRSVRDRLYRGMCQSVPYLPEVFDLFNANREGIYGLYLGQHGLDDEVLDETLEYLDEFYEVINDERKSKRTFVDHCRST